MGHIYNIAKRWLVPLSCTHYQGFYYHGQLSLISYKLRDAGINKLFGKVSKTNGVCEHVCPSPHPPCRHSPLTHFIIVYHFLYVCTLAPPLSGGKNRNWKLPGEEKGHIYNCPKGRLVPLSLVGCMFMLLGLLKISPVITHFFFSKNKFIRTSSLRFWWNLKNIYMLNFLILGNCS